MSTGQRKTDLQDKVEVEDTADMWIQDDTRECLQKTILCSFLVGANFYHFKCDLVAHYEICRNRRAIAVCPVSILRHQLLLPLEKNCWTLPASHPPGLSVEGTDGPMTLPRRPFHAALLCSPSTRTPQATWLVSAVKHLAFSPAKRHCFKTQGSL